MAVVIAKLTYPMAMHLSQEVNIIAGAAEERSMTTGVHVVQNISCCQCKVVLGWAYVKAYDEENKYKEGKFILEKKLLVEIPSSL
ncbi:hypothetical protein [Absidia glauca]|uniref:Protein yippee-like n=1 Tax=Absidia glauca TaxID=4829 RepID=A0A163JEG2_ABSGL|nr:hypothetical protein [Absidia glauca]